MSNLWMDLRVTVRHLLHRPAFALALVLPLALGIGANSAIFSVVNAVLLRPLPYENPERLVRVWENRPRMGDAQSVAALTLDHFRELREDNEIFDHVAVYGRLEMTFSDAEEPIRLATSNVSPALFPLLGIEPALGGTFAADSEQPGKGRLVVLSHASWQSYYGSDPAVVGKTMRLDEDNYTIVGVMPKGFSFPDRETQLWVPMVLEPPQPGNVELMPVLGRLTQGVSIEQAEQAAAGFMEGLREREPESPMHEGVTVHLTSLHEQVVGGVRPALLVLSGAVAFVLLIACANVANLLLARGAGRERELAVRAAIGAGRVRIAVQMFTEAIVVSVIGAAAGLLLAFGGIRLLGAYSPGNIPRLEFVSLDAPVILFTLLLTCITALIFGLAPALRAARADLASSLKEASGSAWRGSRLLSGTRARSLIAVLEVALAVLLLVGAGLMIRSFSVLVQQDPGYESAGAMTMSFNLPRHRYADGEAQTGFFRRLVKEVGEISGVEEVGIANVLPLERSRFIVGVMIEGRPRPANRHEAPRADFRMVSSGYFRAMGIRKLQGRVFSIEDRQGSPPVVVINQAMADSYFPTEDPVGQRLQFGEIVGVVNNVKPQGLDSDPTPEVFVNYLQASGPMARFISNMNLVVRTRSDRPTSLLPAIRTRIRALDSELPIDRVETMEQRVSDSVAEPRFHALALGLFAGLALLLSATGIYSVVSYSVSQRRRETGIRMALGADSRRVFRMILKESSIVLLVGLGLGLMGSFALTRLMQSLLFGVSATDPLTYIGISLVTAMVVLTASFLPARRAAGIDPVSALRHE